MDSNRACLVHFFFFGFVQLCSCPLSPILFQEIHKLFSSLFIFTDSTFHVATEDHSIVTIGDCLKFQGMNLFKQFRQVGLFDRCLYFSLPFFGLLNFE